MIIYVITQRDNKELVGDAFISEDKALAFCLRGKHVEYEYKKVVLRDLKAVNNGKPVRGNTQNDK